VDESSVAVGSVATADVLGHGPGERVPGGVVGFLTTNSAIAQKWLSMRFRKLA
jgi:hypothetical protein